MARNTYKTRKLIATKITSNKPDEADAVASHMKHCSHAAEVLRFL